MRSSIAALAFAGLASGFAVDKRQAATVTVTVTKTQAAPSTTVPAIFAVSPEIYNGPTSSGAAPFLAQTNPAPFSAQGTYVANFPLQTALPIAGNTNNSNIFHLMGQLSPYFPTDRSFGVQEIALPPGANITWLNMLSRHGSRYPTFNSSQQAAAYRLIAAAQKGAKFTGALTFLNTFQYKLGYEVMVPIGKQELFDSGVLHYYDYAHLYNPNASYVFRTTTEERMRETGEYFMTGFFGLDWEKRNIKLEFMIEQNGFNTSLAGYFDCPQSNANASYTGDVASTTWRNIYLQNATTRFNSKVTGYKFTVADLYGMQGLCAYETVAFGYSAFCDLFTYAEWEGYEYSIDLSFAGNQMFQAPAARGTGIGYVQELLARLTNSYAPVSGFNTSNNGTLDTSNVTFPLNQTLYFDFSHDTNIASILTAFNFTQFQPLLSATAIQPNRMLIISEISKFAARLDIEVILAPHPVSANRTCANDAYTNATGPATKYIHFILNQRTLPLFPGYPACGDRTDGWCELDKYLEQAHGLLAAAQFDYSCFGNYSTVPYGTLHNGVPLPPGSS